MSYKTRRILFFVTVTIISFSYTSQAKYLLVEVDGEPKIDLTILPGVLPVNLTTDIPEAMTEIDNDGTSDWVTSATTLANTPEINSSSAFKTTTAENDFSTFLYRK